MKKLKVLCTASLAITMAVAGCSDATSPASRAVLVPVPRVSKIQGGPPDSTFNVSATPGSQAYLTKFTWDTWVTLESPGTITLISKPKLAGASNYYVEGGPVGANGIIDPHDGSCRLYLYVQDNYGPLTGFMTGNACATPARIDTLLSRRLQTPWVARANLPRQYPEECSHDPSVLCHSVDPGDYSTVRERPIPVTLNKLQVNKHTSTFDTHTPFAFTASKSPDAIYFPDRWNGVPMIMTLWQWIGADNTRNPTPPWWGPGGAGPCFGTASTTCNYAPYESGRMIVKAFTGGWEQTNSVTVQCLANPNDEGLNDSTNDFSVRSSMLAALDTSNVDSLPGRGYDSLKLRGWKHESGGAIFKMNDSTTQAFFFPSADGIGTECLYSADTAPPLPPGAVRMISIFHTHVTEYGKVVFGCPNEGGQRFAQSPYDTLPNAHPRLKVKISHMGQNGGGSDSDWDAADRATVRAGYDVPVFVVEKGGKVWRLDPRVPKSQRPNNSNHWQALGGKCQWVK